MITLQQDQLVFRFPHIDEGVGIQIDFQRTLRLPDCGPDYHLPPGLGRFPLRHIEDFDLGSSIHRKARGGIIMPMFQTDALWLNFHSLGYGRPKLPVALKIGAGKINAVSGEKWADGLSQYPQNYVVLPDQPWLDGFNVEKGKVRQFVAMPLGQGYTVEEQIDPESDVGGIQIESIPMKKDAYEELRAKREEVSSMQPDVMMASRSVASMEMGLGMGGSMRQEIYDDEYGLDVWDVDKRQRCFLILANVEQWMTVTGEEPPLSPISAEVYSKVGLPWFDYYDGDRKAIEGAKALGTLKTVKMIAADKREPVWPEEKSKLNYLLKKIKGVKISDGSWRLRSLIRAFKSSGQRRFPRRGSTASQRPTNPSPPSALEISNEASVERVARQHEQAVVAEKDAFITELKGLIEKLEGQVQDYRRARFGPKSEKLDPAQLELALEDLKTAIAETQAQIAAVEEKIAASASDPQKAAPREPRKARALPETRPRVERLNEPDSIVCPCVCGDMVRIGKDQTKRLDFIPAHWSVLRPF